MKKNQDKLTGTLKDSLGIIKQAAINLWHSPLHRTYTDHKPEGHSERIIEKLNMLLADVQDELALNPEEVYVLFASAYLHDIGMQSQKTEFKTLDEIRDQHHEISRKMILGSVSDRSQYPDLGVLTEFVDEVALVSAAHRRLDISSNDFADRPKGGVTLRLRLLSALLRLADELDMDSRRVIMSNIKVADVSQFSLLHWWRCDFVEAVSVQNGVITARCVVPSEEYIYYVKASVERGLRDAVEKTREFLWPTVRLSVGASVARISPTKAAMSAESFAAFRAQVMSEVRQSAQKASGEMRDLHDRERREATLLGEEAQRIHDKDPPSAADLYRQAAFLFQQLGMARSQAVQLEALARLQEQNEQVDQAADTHEALSQLWVANSEPFRARGAMEKAIALIPVENVVSLSFRKIWFVNILTLLGDFGNARQTLQQVSDMLQANPTFLSEQANLIVAFMTVQISFLIAVQEWSQALLQCQSLLATIEQSAPPQQVGQCCYEFSFVASHAGDHALAQKLIERTNHAWQEALMTNLSLARDFHARRGYVHARASLWQSSFSEFETALGLAEEMGDERALVVQYENLLKVARRIEGQEQVILARWSRVADLGDKLTAVLGNDDLGLASDKEHLYDSLAHYLYGFRQATADNSIGGVARAQQRLAELYEKAGRWQFALKLYTAIYSRDEIKALAEKLAEEGNADAGTYTSDLVQQLGSTAHEQAGVGVLVTALADVIPDDRIAAVAERLVGFCETLAEDDDPAKSLLSALSLLAARLEAETLHRCVRMAITLLGQDGAHGWQIQEAATNYLAFVAERIPEGLHVEAIAGLTALVGTPHAGLPALSALMGLEPHLAEPQRSEVRELVRGLALDKGQFWACQFYVRAEYGPLNPSLGRGVFEGYLTYMQNQEKMADSNNWTVDAGPTLWSMKYFKEYIQPDQVGLVAHALVRLAVHSENFPTHREDAIATLGYLAEVVPRHLIAGTIQTLLNLANQPEIGPVTQMMTNGGTDPLQRYRFHIGTQDDIRGTAIATLGKFCVRLRGRDLEQAVQNILSAAGDITAAVRVGAAMALSYAQPVLKGENLRAAMMQLYGLLHDPEPKVQQASVYALVGYAQLLTKREASLCLGRLLVLSRTGGIKVRLNALHGLKILVGLPALTHRQAEIKTVLEEMKQDISYQVRKAVQVETPAS